MKKFFAMALVGGIGLLGCVSGMANEAFGGAKPLLKEVKINGEVFYEAGKVIGKTITVSASKPMDVQYTIVNEGNAPAGQDGRVFVHFCDDKGKILVGGDYAPKKPMKSWDKGAVAVDQKKVNLAKVKGQTVKMFLGIYFPAAKGARIKFDNKEQGGGNRVVIGSIKAE